MALSVIVYPGDGVTTQFSIPFALGYIKESDITARVGNEQDGTGNPIYRTLTFLSPTSVVVSGTPAPLGTNIVFRRTVDREQLIVDYEDGDIINEENMNTAQKQTIMLVHEVLDGRFAQFQSGFDMGGFNITGLGAPVNQGDATNKAYVDGLISDGAANAAIAVAARDAAIAARNAAQASQSAAAGSAASASTDAATASNAATTAVGARDVAVTSRNEAVSARNYAVAANTTAQTAAVSTAADRVQTAADRAQTGTDATNAATARDNSYKWSSNEEDSNVNDGIRTGFSSFHYSRKSAASATSASNSATAAAASAAAAATFNPANYVSKVAGAPAQVMANAGITVQPASGNAMHELRAPSGMQGMIDMTSGGRTRDYDWRITPDLSSERLYFVYNGGAASFFMNTDGNFWTNSYGWLHDRFAQKNVECQHNSHVVEFSGYDSGITDSVGRASNPYVQIGFRRGDIRLGGASFVQAVAIRNN